jgi:hypothetical protein
MTTFSDLRMDSGVQAALPLLHPTKKEENQRFIHSSTLSGTAYGF